LVWQRVNKYSREVITMGGKTKFRGSESALELSPLGEDEGGRGLLGLGEKKLKRRMGMNTLPFHAVWEREKWFERVALSQLTSLNTGERGEREGRNREDREREKEASFFFMGGRRRPGKRRGKRGRGVDGFQIHRPKKTGEERTGVSNKEGDEWHASFGPW